MDPTKHITAADLSSSEAGGDLWELALPHVPEALAGRDSDLLDALEAAGRAAGLSQKVPIAELLDAYTDGSLKARRLILEGAGAGAEAGTLRLLALEHVALTRIAAGYAEGLQETISRLRRLAEESSPLDVDTGAMKPAEFGERLSLEVERCQRMDLSLGLVELGVEAPGVAGGEQDRGVAHRVGECVRENLRSYDAIGLTESGDFVLVLPDISRRGLAGAAERLRRGIDTCAGHGRSPEVTFALAHYDFVDVNATEMLAGLERSLQHARQGRRPLAWD